MLVESKNHNETGQVQTLLWSGAQNIRNHALECAEEMNVSGFVVVYDSLGLQRCLDGLGSGVTSLNYEVALGKIKTVLATHRSTRLQAERIRDRNYDRANYGRGLGSLFGGGLVVLGAGREFIGAAAFSGGSEAEDEFIVCRAIHNAGFNSDISFPEAAAILEKSRNK